MISIEHLCLRLGHKSLFEDLNWTIHPKQKIGLVGANGSGKSTLMALLCDTLQPDAGDIYRKPQLTLAHMAQETPGSSQKALDFVLAGHEEYTTLQRDLQEQHLSPEKMANLHTQLERIDAYRLPAIASGILYGLGFDETAQQNTVNNFSGGWRMRLNLAKTLINPADLMLLDEPTNHLDLPAILWLQQFIVRFQGAVILISHDREFLDAMVTGIAHLDNKHLKIYGGNYSTFEQTRAQQLMLQQAGFEKQQKQKAHLQRYVDRFRYKASKARQAQSRLKALARLETTSAVVAQSPFQFTFPNSNAAPNPLITLEKVCFGYRDKQALRQLNLTLTSQERIALLGPNGAGKSTLMKLICQQLAPQSGTIIRGKGLKIGYFTQHQGEKLDLTASPVEHLLALEPAAREQACRDFLGGFDFHGDKATSPVQHFSGGEKSRLALALIVWQAPNLLLLDEPSNHLDMDMQEALTLALQSYDGALILISHDRHLIRTCVDKLYCLADGRLSPFDGSIDDYQEWLLARWKQNTSSSDKTEKTANLSRQRQQLKKDIARAEKLLEKLMAEEEKLQTQLADPTLYEAEQKAKLALLLQQQKTLKQKLSTTEAQWLEQVEALETLHKPCS